MADYTVRQLADAAYGAGFRGPALVTAVAIALAENPGRRLRATNHNGNGTVDRGPWQINSATQNDIHANGLNAENLTDAAKLAFMVYQKQGFNAWTTYNPKYGSKYKLYLPRAGRAAIHVSSANDAQVMSLPGDAQQAAVGEGVRAVGGGIINAATAIPTLVGHLLSPEFWKMVGIGVIAAAFVIIGLIIIAESNKDVRAATAHGVETAAVV